jgi:saccharopine dehydrogenase-like NADP-dependent oxidoreductase
MPERYTVLVVGGYGVFGGRLVGLLRDEERLTLLVAGRSKAKARAFCATLDGRATMVPVAFDRAGDLPTQIAALKPALVVDASGPFQAYGDRPYRLIEACIERGVPYLDLADGSDFVHGVRAFDEAARAKGVFILSGVSSFPVLTAAVVRHLASDMAQVTDIVGGIAPTPYAGVGENVVRAIAAYAGGPVALRRDGAWTTAHGFTEQRRATIAPPGRLPLRSTLFSLVDVPDLRALPALWPGVRRVWMGAGPVPEILHRALILLSRLRRSGLLPAITPLAPLMHAAINRLRWGEHRGGMFVAPIARAFRSRARGTWWRRATTAR